MLITNHISQISTKVIAIQYKLLNYLVFSCLHFSSSSFCFNSISASCFSSSSCSFFIFSSLKNYKNEIFKITSIPCSILVSKRICINYILFNFNNIYVIRFCSTKSALYASTVCLNKVHSLLTNLTKLTIEFSVDISPSACQANL